LPLHFPQVPPGAQYGFSVVGQDALAPLPLSPLQGAQVFVVVSHAGAPAVQSVVLPAVQTAQAPLARHAGAPAVGHSSVAPLLLSPLQATHSFVVRSQAGCVPVHAPVLSTAHSTQLPSTVQTGAVAGHGALAPLLLSPVHERHAPVMQTARAPRHSASVAQEKHAALDEGGFGHCDPPLTVVPRQVHGSIVSSAPHASPGPSVVQTPSTRFVTGP
jgi:hypothetical protein